MVINYAAHCAYVSIVFMQLVGRDALYKLWYDLVCQLEDLCYLQNELQFSVSLAQHSKVAIGKDKITVFTWLNAAATIN